MPSVTFISHDGRAQTLQADSGASLMHVATTAGLRGIIGECGGVLSCATCHVQVDAGWADRVGGPGPAENDMLEYAEARLPTSRLGCQVVLTDALDGLVVHIPEHQ